MEPSPASIQPHTCRVREAIRHALACLTAQYKMLVSKHSTFKNLCNKDYFGLREATVLKRFCIHFCIDGAFSLDGSWRYSQDVFI